MTIMAKTPGKLDFDTVPRYQPNIGGLRHITNLTTEPVDGTLVVALCELERRVGRSTRSEPVYDCSSCAELWRDPEWCGP